MDHFARVDDELVQAQKQGALQRNFQGYSTCGGADIYGFGVSAISQSGDMYWQNEKDLETYYRVLDAGMLPVSNGYVLSADDKMRRAGNHAVDVRHASRFRELCPKNSASILQSTSAVRLRA